MLAYIYVSTHSDKLAISFKFHFIKKEGIKQNINLDIPIELVSGQSAKVPTAAVASIKLKH